MILFEKIQRKLNKTALQSNKSEEEILREERD